MCFYLQYTVNQTVLGRQHPTLGQDAVVEECGGNALQFAESSKVSLCTEPLEIPVDPLLVQSINQSPSNLEQSVLRSHVTFSADERKSVLVFSPKKQAKPSWRQECQEHVPQFISENLTKEEMSVPKEAAAQALSTALKLEKENPGLRVDPSNNGTVIILAGETSNVLKAKAAIDNICSELVTDTVSIICSPEDFDFIEQVKHNDLPTGVECEFDPITFKLSLKGPVGAVTKLINTIEDFSSHADSHVMLDPLVTEFFKTPVGRGKLEKFLQDRQCHVALHFSQLPNLTLHLLSDHKETSKVKAVMAQIPFYFTSQSIPIPEALVPIIADMEDFNQLCQAAESEHEVLIKQFGHEVSAAGLKMDIISSLAKIKKFLDERASPLPPSEMKVGTLVAKSLQQSPAGVNKCLQHIHVSLQFDTGRGILQFAPLYYLNPGWEEACKKSVSEYIKDNVAEVQKLVVPEKAYQDVMTLLYTTQQDNNTFVFHYPPQTTYLSFAGETSMVKATEARIAQICANYAEEVSLTLGAGRQHPASGQDAIVEEYLGGNPLQFAESSKISLCTEPLEIPVDPHLVQSINRSPNNLQQSVWRSHVVFSADEEKGMLVFSPTRQAKPSWRQECQEHVPQFISENLTKEEMSVPKEAAAQALSTALKLEKENPGLTVDPSNDGTVIILAGETSNVLKAKAAINSICSELVTDTISVSLTPEDFDFIEQVKQNDIPKNIKCKFEPSKFTLSLKGPVGTVTKFKSSIEDFSSHADSPVMLDPLVTEFFKTPVGRGKLENFLQDRQCHVALYFSQYPNITLHLLSDRKETSKVKAVMAQIPLHFTSRSIPLPDAVVPIISDMKDFNQLCQAVESEHEVLIKQIGHEVSAAGLKTDITSSLAKIKKFLDERAFLLPPSEMKVGTLVAKSLQQNPDGVKKCLQPFHVSLQFDTGRGILRFTPLHYLNPGWEGACKKSVSEYIKGNVAEVQKIIVPAPHVQEFADRFPEKVVTTFIPLPTTVTTPPVSQEFKEHCQRLCIEKHVSIQPKEDALQICGFIDTVGEVIVSLENFIKKKCTVNQSFSVQKGIWRLFCGPMKIKWVSIEASCKDSDVLLTQPTDDEGQFIIGLKGDKTEVEKVIQALTHLVRSVIITKVPLVGQQICRYFSGEESDGRMKILHIERSAKVCIEMCVVEEDMDTQVPELGSTTHTAPKIVKECTAEVVDMKRITVYVGDITEFRADVIVNAANEELKHIGGVANAILKKGGQEIQDASDTYVASYGKLSPGEVWLSRVVGRLQCSALIHAVGPRWQHSSSSQQLLYKVCSRCLEQAEAFMYNSIALPAISSGTFGCPIDQCANILISATVDFCRRQRHTALDDINFVLFKHSDVPYFVKALQAHLSPQSVRLRSESSMKTSSSFGVSSYSAAASMHLSAYSSYSSQPHANSPKKVSLDLAPQKMYKGRQSSEQAQTPAKATATGAVKLGNGISVEILIGDISSEVTDAIVNSTGREMNLKTSGGVSAALLKKGGRELQKACDKARKKQHLSEGKVIDTKPGNLRCKRVFHMYFQKHFHIEDIVRVCIDRAVELNYRSISFPGIGTGTGELSPDASAKGMINGLQQCKPHKLHVRIVLIDDRVYRAFKVVMDDLQSTWYERTRRAMKNWIWGQTESVDEEDNEPMDVDQENETEMELRIFGETEESVKSAEDSLHTLINKQFKTEDFDDERISSLKPHQEKLLQEKARSMLLKFRIDRNINCIDLTGNKDSILEMRVEIEKALSQVEKNASRKLQAETMRKIVQWKRQDSNDEVLLYEPETNLEIEQTYTEGKPSYTSVEHFTIDFKKMEEIDHTMGDKTCRVKRVTEGIIF